MYRADVYVAGANDGSAALAAWAECSLLIMHGDAAAAAKSSSARSQSVTVVSEAGGEPLCAGGWATIPAPQKKPQLAMEEQQRPPRPSRTAIRAKTNSFELLRLLPPPVSPTLGVGTELEIVEPLLQQAKEGVGRKSSRPGSPAPRKKKQGHDVQRRRSDQHRGHPGPEKPSGGGKHNRSSGDSGDYRRLTKPSYLFHQKNSDCRKPDPWGDSSVRGFRGGMTCNACDVVARALRDQEQVQVGDLADLVRVVAKAPEWAHVQAMQRPSMFYLWELYWDAEVAYRHVARAFASVRKEKKGEDARAEVLLHASTSSAIERADEGGAEESPAAAAAPVTLFVRNDAGRTRTVHIELRASVAELEEAVRRKVRGTEEMRLCAVGGPPLVAARGLTLAECGIRADSSLQLLGRLPGGGGELVLDGRTYAAGDDGRLDRRFIDQNY